MNQQSTQTPIKLHALHVANRAVEVTDFRLRDEISEPLRNQLAVAGIRPIPEQTKQLCKLPDRRAYRSMSRTGVLVCSVGLQLKDAVLAVTSVDPDSVGIYCAVQNGPEDYGCVEKVETRLDDSEEGASFAKTYKRYRSPKHYLKQLPNLAPAQLGIFLNVQGPTLTYTHSKFAVKHAFDRAGFDLKTGRVKAALVCSAFGFEDPIVLQSTKDCLSANQTLCEGAASLLLENPEEHLIQDSYFNQHFSENYGIADPLIHYIQEEL